MSAVRHQGQSAQDFPGFPNTENYFSAEAAELRQFYSPRDQHHNKLCRITFPENCLALCVAPFLCRRSHVRALCKREAPEETCLLDAGYSRMQRKSSSCNPRARVKIARNIVLWVWLWYLTPRLGSYTY